ncbi:DsbA family protein [Mycolicibacterium llatzerense]|uniref:DSBA oxidoreductase n=1 Tax=Mycolicibacterium llatzerense TaxID=280871 RepID=A0A0D1JPI4_9MYCO|nr:thioredoxin domain-containing protein [Mycolicibacterium llatzerense]KIU14489.1 DSBA oxidoreductase [Mycolicibacterium llatzerense]
MARSRRILLTALVIAALAIGMLVYLSVRDRGPATAQMPTTSEVIGQVVRENSRRLNTAAGSDVTLVEFLDFECEGCRALYPVIEQVRAEYGDRVNFVIRYFPLQAHVNSERAARAVEAAAQQGRLEAMYKKMYDTQAQWGEKRTSADDVFRGFAAELGLNMAAFDVAYADPATVERVRLDVADGRALGVQGTPTVFLNGARIQPRSYPDLATELDKALDH